jgi:hypothetical protein
MSTNINFNNILGIVKGCNILLTSTTPSLLLDLYPNAAVAYSLRKLRTAYSGSAIRVRRSSDNAEQDINFVAGDLDTQSLLDFVGNNLLTYSEDISQTVWTKTNLNTTGTPAYLNVETAPDGLITGDKIIENTTTNIHSVLTSYSVTNGLDYNISVYLKQAERTKVQISSSISNLPQTCDVDLTNGTVSNNIFSNTPVVTSEANGWYRFSITITAGTTGSYTAIRINLYNASNQRNYLGDGTSGAYVWGFQLTQSSSVLPYTKTDATVAGNGFVTTWYDQSGNASNVTQSTAILQPRIVVSGALILQNGKPSISDLVGSNIKLSVTLNGSANFYAFNVMKYLSGATNILYSGQLADRWIFAALTGDTNNSFSQNAGTPTFRKNGVLQTYVNRGAAATSLANQSLFTVTASTTSWTQLTIGYPNTAPMFNMQEVVIYYANKDADRVGIESNINSFYTIF